MASLSKDDATPINDIGQNIHGVNVVDAIDTPKEKTPTTHKIASENEYVPIWSKIRLL